MKDIMIIEKDDDENAKVIPLATRRKALRAGGGEAQDGNWLSQLLPGTEFSTSGGGGPEPTWLLRDWVLLGHKRGVSLVAPTQFMQDDKAWMTVKPQEFSKCFILEAITYEDTESD